MIYRRYSVPTMWEEMDHMQREMNKLMNVFAAERPRGVFPVVNAWTTDDEEIVTAELPGIDPKALELTIVNDVLTLSGERESTEADEKLRYHRQERASGKFSRSIQMAFPVDAEKVTAAYENGILKVTLPRAEDDKPRKIAIKA